MGEIYVVLIKLPGRKSFAQFVGLAMKVNYGCFISNLFTELLWPERNFLDLKLRKTVIVFTAAKRTLLITVLIIVNLQRLSLRKCCSGLMPLTIPRSILMLFRKLFGFPNKTNVIKKKLNYTLLFLRHNIYRSKLQNASLLIRDFINKISYKYRIETFSQEKINHYFYTEWSVMYSFNFHACLCSNPVFSLFFFFLDMYL